MQACETGEHSPATQVDGDLTSLSDEASLKPLPARFMLRDGREFPCKVSALTNSSAVFVCGEPVCEGSLLVAYIEGVGRIEGRTGEACRSGFTVHFAMNDSGISRLERNLRWLRLKQQGLASEERDGTRFQPPSGTARVTLGGGEEHACEVLDISLSGAALRAGIRPEIGSCVLLGKTRGRVIRHMADGFAIEFVAPLEQAALHQNLR
jgi:hypothetical protein